MRLLTMATLSAAYVLMGLVTAVLLWQAGGGWGAGVAAAIGVLGLFVAFHALISSLFGQADIKRDVTRIRDANIIFAEELEKTQLDVTKLSTMMHEEKAKRSQVLNTEVRMLEDLVRRMSDTMQARLTSPKAANEEVVRTPVAKPSPPRPTPQELLLQTIRDALADNRVDLYLQPVVSLPQRRTAFYESYSRLRDPTGRIMLPAEYLPAAEPAG
jgi:cyclic-di-GMP phosphodiesterase TipF (flagellum assembly factor)